MPSLASGRPASAPATQPSRSRRTGVCRACGRVSPGICSAKVTAGHSAVRHLNRRTSTTITTGSPPNGASPSRRSYRPCIRPESLPHPGHRAKRARERVRSMTTPASRCTDSTATSARCGRTSLKPSEPHTHPERSNSYNVTRSATEPVHPYAAGELRSYADTSSPVRSRTTPAATDIQRMTSALTIALKVAGDSCGPSGLCSSRSRRRRRPR